MRTVTGTLPAKLCVSSARPLSSTTALVRRNQPSPAASMEGAVRNALPDTVHPGAVVAVKVSCNLNCALAELKWTASESARDHATMRGEYRAALMRAGNAEPSMDIFIMSGARNLQRR